MLPPWPRTSSDIEQDAFLLVETFLGFAPGSLYERDELGADLIEPPVTTPVPWPSELRASVFAALLSRCLLGGASRNGLRFSAPALAR